MGSLASLFLATAFGAVGLAYLVSGKGQHLFIPLRCGVGLMTFPYFISNAVAMVIFGMGLSAAPYLFRE